MGALAASFLGDLAVGTGVGHRRTRPAPGRPGPSRVLAGNRWSWASGCVSNPLPNASSRVVICWLRLARTATVAWVMTPSAWLIGGAVASWAERIAVWIWAARCWRLRWRPPRRRAAASLARDSWRPSSGWGRGPGRPARPQRPGRCRRRPGLPGKRPPAPTGDCCAGVGGSRWPTDGPGRAPRWPQPLAVPGHRPMVGAVGPDQVSQHHGVPRSDLAPEVPWRSRYLLAANELTATTW
jgi:hypothetical protein